MAMGIHGPGTAQSRINVTPLIDVLLVLLVIFIMVAPVMTKALQSELPRRAQGALSAQATMNRPCVRICADGRLLLNNEEIQAQALGERLRQAFSTEGGATVLFIDADEAVGYGRVVEVMDLGRDAGAPTIGLAP